MAPSSPKEVQAVADANTNFSSDLFTELTEEFPENLIYSPFSLSAVMAMLRVGSKGKTATEIDEAFHYPTNTGVLAKGYRSVLASLQTPRVKGFHLSNSKEGYTLSSANRLYTNIGFRIKREYVDGLKDLLAEVEQLDFKKTVASAGTINGWVDKITHGKIQGVISPQALHGASLVLVNGIYFKGLWSCAFKATKTSKKPFFLNEKDNVTVDMMRQTNNFLYGELEDLQAHAVALPYKGDGERLCMIVIAPMEKTGLPRVEEGISDYSPETIFANLRQEDRVAVRLPKFKMESTMDLKGTLQNLGLSSMFSGNADFSGIPEGRTPLYVSQIIQKAMIEVNEEGTEAAAATGAIAPTAGSGKRRYIKPIQFNADRPFIFQIVDRQTKFVLFAGRCQNPLESQ